MILELFLYFAQFPLKSGVLSLFLNGSSNFPQYASLIEQVNDLPDPRIPGIENLVFGQSFDSVKSRVDNITGTYLFIDYGEFSSGRDSRNSLHDTQKLAATVAMKMPNSTDMMEEAISSDITLQLINNLRAHLLHDSDKSEYYWMNRSAINQQDIVPFVSKELNSFGWTLMFNSDASDMFDLKSIMESLP